MAYGHFFRDQHQEADDDDEQPKQIPCPYCDKGILHLIRLPHDGYNAGYSDKSCPICGGKGEIPADLKFESCPECQGAGVYPPNRGEMDPDPFHCETCLGLGVIEASVHNQGQVSNDNPVLGIGFFLVILGIFWSLGKIFGWW